MAALDPRLLELVQSLVAARLDWLAIELIDGVQDAHHVRETETALAAVRQNIRTRKPPLPKRQDPQRTSPVSAPLTGDEQIEWASRQVAERLEDALKQLDAAIENLQALGGGAMARGEHSAQIVLTDVEGMETRPDDILAARTRLAGLRTGLETWSKRVRSETPA